MLIPGALLEMMLFHRTKAGEFDMEPILTINQGV